MVGSRPEDALSDVEQRAVERIEREIRQVLRETPSPDFMARVRQRVAVKRLPARRWVPWCMAAGLSAALLVAFVAFRDRQPTPASGLDAAYRPRVVPASRSQVPDAPVVGRPTVAGVPVRAARARIAPAPRKAHPEVLVPPGQLEAIQQFVEMMRTSPVDAQPLSLVVGGVPSVPHLSDIAIAPLKIEPLARPADPGQLGGRDENR